MMPDMTYMITRRQRIHYMRHFRLLARKSTKICHIKITFSWHVNCTFIRNVMQRFTFVIVYIYTIIWSIM